MQHLRGLLAYDAWANRETLRSLKEGAPPRGLMWMAHIVGAEYLWLARLRREDQNLPVWPELDLEACEERLGQLSKLWPEYLDDTKSFTEEVPYTNSRGEAWTSTVEEILTHVVLHSAYHRGQIAADVRAGGGVPAYTDYIHATRQGLIE
jgi:uncharacterized damage-inducible protein DinB